jgi:hypothetical protein
VTETHFFILLTLSIILALLLLALLLRKSKFEVAGT